MEGRLGISKDTPVRVQVRTERVSCKWKAEDRYRCRTGRNDFSLCVGGHGRKLEHQGGTRNMRAWAQGCHGPGKCCQVASDFFRLAVALSVSNSPDQWLDWDTRRKLLQRRGCSFFMLQQAIVSLRDALESRLHSGVVLPRFSLCNQQLHLLVWASDWWLRLPPGAGVERGRLQQFWQTRAQKKNPRRKKIHNCSGHLTAFQSQGFWFQLLDEPSRTSHRAKAAGFLVVICVVLYGMWHLQVQRAYFEML